MYFDEPYMNGYVYEYTNPAGDILAVVLALYLAVLAVILAVKLAEYLLKGFAMYRIAQRQGPEYPWLAFVPFARMYLQGELSGEIRFKKRCVSSPGMWLILLPIISSIVFGVTGMVLWGLFMVFAVAAVASAGGFGILAAVFLILLVLFILAAVAYGAVYKVLRALVDYQIYRRFTANNTAVVHAILSVTVPLYESVCLFVYRDRAYEPGQGPEEKPEGSPVLPDPGAASGEEAGAAADADVPASSSSDVQTDPAEPSFVLHPAEEGSKPEETGPVRAESESMRAPYVYRDSFELEQETPAGYDVSGPEEESGKSE